MFNTSIRRIASPGLRQGEVAFRSSRLQQLNVRCKSAVTTNSNNSKQKATKTASSSSASASSSETQSSVPVAKCLLAAAAGVGTVSAAAAAVENATASSCPSFDPKGQRYDASTFLGRFSRMLLACDPYLLVYSEEQVRRSKEMVEHWPQWFDGTKEMDRTLWEAKRIAEAAVHPDTNEVIPRPFRMSGYVFFNGPVCVAMIASQSTLPLLGWAWVCLNISFLCFWRLFIFIIINYTNNANLPPSF